jgi:homoserine kinase
LELDCHNDIPHGRGMGSSAAAIVSGIELARALSTDGRDRLGDAEALALAAELEGHPDNAAPAEFGGFNVVRASSRQRFAVSPALKFILLIPDFEVRTADARALLPKKLDRLRAIESCGNAATIAAAFASGEYAKLRGAFADHLHQPFRKHLVPFFDDAISAAEKAGALGGFLSGSGSTIAAVTLDRPENVGAAMLEAAPNGSRVLLTSADNRGAHFR